jgi:hypothetical protein
MATWPIAGSPDGAEGGDRLTSFVNITDVHAVAKGRALRYRGRLDPPAAHDRVSGLVRVYLGL